MALSDTTKVAAIVADSGGRIVGRTRLQKIAYLLSQVGLEDHFDFIYKHYGPYSENLANAAGLANLFGDLNEIEKPTSWGGSYSIFTVATEATGPENRRKFAQIAAEADAVALELAATAVFLSEEGYPDPWEETCRRKPDKSDASRINVAKNLLNNLSKIDTPRRLPSIA